MSANEGLFQELRGFWERTDPVPEGFVDAMVAVTAVADVSEELALLLLVAAPERLATRGTGAAVSLQFSDGTTSVLLRVSHVDGDRRRIDGWIDASVRSAVLVRADTEDTAELIDDGRFVFEAVSPALVRLRLVIDGDAGPREFTTVQFEL